MTKRDETGWSGHRWWSALSVIAVAAGLPLLSAVAANAATFVVNSTLDAVDAVPGNGTCLTVAGDCTLRAAVQEANGSAGADIITVPVADTIKLTIPGPGEDLAATGDLDITEEVTITGDSPFTTIIDAKKLDRIFDVRVASSVTLAKMTLRNGSVADDGGAVANTVGGTLALQDLVLEKNYSVGAGGAVFTNAGILDVKRCLIRKNKADDDGGGIAHGSPSDLDIEDSVIEKNTAGTGSGGIYTQGNTTIESCTVAKNKAVLSNGGGIQALLDLEVSDSKIVNNKAPGATANGGGIFVQGTLNASRVEIAKNSAGGYGGGITVIGASSELEQASIVSNTAGQSGGGVYVSLGAGLTVVNVTIAKNKAKGAAGGGGIFSQVGTTLAHVTLADNSATVASSIGGATNVTTILTVIKGKDNCDGPVVSDGASVENLATCGVTLSNVDPLLGKLTLVDTQAPALTSVHWQVMPLRPGSPAIDNTGCFGVFDDARLAVRPAGATCDSGAYEVSP